jgi:hypothetical protein
MPLPNVLSGTSQRCKAESKRSQERCKNPAAYGMPVCRYHGARKPETIRRGANHPQYKHGRETLVAKAERSAMLSQLREIEAIMFATGIAKGARWRGRKANQ